MWLGTYTCSVVGTVPEHGVDKSPSMVENVTCSVDGTVFEHSVETS